MFYYVTNHHSRIIIITRMFYHGTLRGGEGGWGDLSSLNSYGKLRYYYSCDSSMIGGKYTFYRFPVEKSIKWGSLVGGFLNC